MSPDPAQLTVAIVEDNIDNMLLLRYYIRKAPVKECFAMETGAELFALRTQTPQLSIDVVFLDIQIPFEDGYSILKQIRADAAWRETRVIAVTAHVMHSDVIRAREAGFDGFLGKPINPALIEEQIAGILGGKAIWDVSY